MNALIILIIVNLLLLSVVSADTLFLIDSNSSNDSESQIYHSKQQTLGQDNDFPSQFEDYKTPRNIQYKGMTFVGDRYCPDVSFDTPDARESLDKLKLTGTDSIALVVTEYQDYATSTNGIYPVYSNFPHDDYYIYKTETPEALESIVHYAHSIGLKVLFKPHIDVAKENDFNIWRGMIGKDFTSKDWEDWFSHYEKFILKYAKLAEKTKSELFSVSTELIYPSNQDIYWRRIVKKIREIYSGIVVDSANWGGEEVDKTWWDVVDFIGVDAYYVNMKTTYNSKLVFGIENQLDYVVNILNNLYLKWGKKILITEIGFCSGDCKRNEEVDGYDHYLQAYFYEKVFMRLAQEDYIVGFFWWSWNTDPNFGGLNDQCISPQHKPAEQVLRKIYQGDKDSFSLLPSKTAKCICTT